MKPLCAHCAQPARLTNGEEVYPHRADLAERWFWVCDPCEARVGCHREGAKTDTGMSDGTMPLGRPANAELRRARSMLHNRLDPLWLRAPRKQRRTARRRAYRVLSRALGLPVSETHVGMFDIETCRAAWRALEDVTYPQIMSEGRFNPELDDEPQRVMT